MNGYRVLVLGTLNQEHHQEGHDRCARVDHELPGVRKPEDRPDAGPSDDDAEGQCERRRAAGPPGDSLRERLECVTDSPTRLLAHGPSPSTSALAAAPRERSRLSQAVGGVLRVNSQRMASPHQHCAGSTRPAGPAYGATRSAMEARTVSRAATGSARKIGPSAVSSARNVQNSSALANVHCMSTDSIVDLNPAPSTRSCR